MIILCFRGGIWPKIHRRASSSITCFKMFPLARVSSILIAPVRCCSVFRLQSLHSLSFSRDGGEFISSHADGSYIIWTSGGSSEPKEQATNPYGKHGIHYFDCEHRDTLMSRLTVATPSGKKTIFSTFFYRFVVWPSICQYDACLIRWDAKQSIQFEQRSPCRRQTLWTNAL